MTQETIDAACGEIAALIQAGTPVDAAVHAGLVTLQVRAAMADMDQKMLRFVQREIPAQKVPSARCVADRLRGKAAPTKADVQEAFHACMQG